LPLERIRKIRQLARTGRDWDTIEKSITEGERRKGQSLQRYEGRIISLGAEMPCVTREGASVRGGKKIQEDSVKKAEGQGTFPAATKGSHPNEKKQSKIVPKLYGVRRFGLSSIGCVGRDWTRKRRRHLPT